MTETRAGAGGDGRFARYTFRLRVSARALAELEAEWGRSRWLWNECVAKSREVHGHNQSHSEDKRTCGPVQLSAVLTAARGVTPWLREGASVPQQQTIRDIAKSRAKALKDIKQRLPVRQRAGMPKLRKKDRSTATLEYTRSGFPLREGRLHLAGGITVTVVWSLDLPAEPTSVRGYRDSLGDWYASFVVAAPTVEPLPVTGAVIGVDWGVREVATTTSDRHDLPHSGYGLKSAAKLARYQRQMARREQPKGKPQTKGYRRAQRSAAKMHKKIARQRLDTGRKWAKMVVADHDQIAVEDFKPKFLAKSTMARKAADAAIGATKRALIEAGRKWGRQVHVVHSAHTTMDCGTCGARAKHRLPLSTRTYTCTACGLSSPRDKNSARVMLVRAGLHPADADRTRPGRPPDAQAA